MQPAFFWRFLYITSGRNAARFGGRIPSNSGRNAARFYKKFSIIIKTGRNAALRWGRMFSINSLSQCLRSTCCPFFWGVFSITFNKTGWNAALFLHKLRLFFLSKQGEKLPFFPVDFSFQTVTSLVQGEMRPSFFWGVVCIIE